VKSEKFLPGSPPDLVKALTYLPLTFLTKGFLLSICPKKRMVRKDSLAAIIIFA
jgi:hypothetical protein